MEQNRHFKENSEANYIGHVCRRLYIIEKKDIHGIIYSVWLQLITKYYNNHGLIDYDDFIIK